MARFEEIYYIRNNAGTYEAWQDNEAAATYSGTALVVDVLDAIETAHSAGGFAVFFEPGTFDMSTNNWTLNTMTDVLIAGAGMGVTTIQNSSTGGDSEPISITNCDYITVRDMSISAGGTDNTTSDALDFDNADYCLVERVEILDSRASGIVFDGKDSGAQAVGNTVRDCVILATSTTSGHGVKLLAAVQTTVTGCLIQDTVGAGIEIQKSSNTAGRPNEPSNYNVISGNRLINCGRDGIEIQSSSYNTIVGNTILNSADDTASRDGIRIATANSIQADGNTITGNIIGDDQGTATQRYGVNVGPAAAAEAVGNQINNNTFFTNLTAPINDGGTNTLVRDNIGAASNIARQVSTATTLLFDDASSVLNVDSSGGTVTVTLPDNDDAAGRSFVVRRDGANTVTVSRAGADTIDGGTTKSLDSDGAAVGVVSVGGNDWITISTTGTVT